MSGRRIPSYAALLACCAILLAGVVGAPGRGLAQPPAVSALSIRSDGDDNLYSIDLRTGLARPIGPTGFPDIESLAFSCEGLLYGVDDTRDQLIRIDPRTGAGVAVGRLGTDVTDTGLTFDSLGNLYMSVDAPKNPFLFFRLNPNTGAATVVGDMGQEVTGLTARGATIFGLGGDNNNNLVRIDPGNGRATAIGPLATVTLTDGGIDFDADGVLWGISERGPGASGASEIFTIDTRTGNATVVTTTRTAVGTPLNGFESLAIPDVPCVSPGPTPTPTGTPAPGASPAPARPAGADDEDTPRRLTEEQRRQRERTNAGGLSDIRTEGDVLFTFCYASPPDITIANRDGQVRVRLIGDAARLCESVNVGDYVEVSGTKLYEQLYEADDIVIYPGGRSR